MLMWYHFGKSDSLLDSFSSPSDTLAPCFLTLIFYFCYDQRKRYNVKILLFHSLFVGQYLSDTAVVLFAMFCVFIMIYALSDTIIFYSIWIVFFPFLQL